MGYQTVFRRYEKKYLVTQEQYDRLAKVFAPRMERDRFSESTISNIYYDTPDFRLIRRSLDRPAYKEKLRLRTYRTPHADTEAFVEIKKKYDHVVYKRRIGMNYQQAVDYLDGAPRQKRRRSRTKSTGSAGFTREFARRCASFTTGLRCSTANSRPARHVRLGHPLANGRFRPCARHARQTAARPERAPHGDQDPRRGAGLARPCALGRRCVPEPLFQIRRGLSDHAARRKNHPI